MSDAEPSVPRRYLGVMVSSTFKDFVQHRDAVIRAISGQGLHPVAMEQDSARPAGTVIGSSLEKVRDAAAYVGIIGHRYGGVPESPEHNPERLSLTELEFREARRLGRPILLFVMGPDHDVKPSAVERDPEKMSKLKAFRTDAKRTSADSRVHRVYKEFNSLSEFEVAATQSVAELRRHLDAVQDLVAAPAPAHVTGDGTDDIPAPPTLYAEPRYIGSHTFVGRAAQLETLTDWATAAEPHPVLLFEAIGGTGKSMLTWEWTTRHAIGARADWAGRFWYSFYEKGAVMADFCRRALAYMTGQPLDAFRKKRQPELSDLLLRQLQARPWLLVLDGLERVLVAYHRYDAAQLADEQAGTSDEIASRDPCAAIRPEDDDLLRQLAGAGPSKILVTSRLVPRVMLNPASQPIPGVLHERLPGLRPADAEALLRTCGVRGESHLMQDYLQRHCDCHPLVTGILAGLVNDYLPDRGHFDAWAADPHYGGRLNLAEVDLVQKRNHILAAALDALPDSSRQLLSTLALLSEAVDYATVEALNPHRPPEPDTAPRSEMLETGAPWTFASNEGNQPARATHAVLRQGWPIPPREHTSRRRFPEPGGAAELTRTVRDLEQRGLLQYDRQAGRYDLHPVVRGVASGGLSAEDRDRLGRRVVDHFSQRSHGPYEQAETLDDLRDGLTVIRTLLRLGRPREALAAYTGTFAEALSINLEAHAETASLLRPFFGRDWTEPPTDLQGYQVSYLANAFARALSGLGELEEARTGYGVALRINLKGSDDANMVINLSNLAETFREGNRLADAERCARIACQLAESLDRPDLLLRARLQHFSGLAVRGLWRDAEDMRAVLDELRRRWPHVLYPAEAEFEYAQLQFYCGDVTDEQLTAVERLAREKRNRLTLRGLHALRGRWLLTLGQDGPAATSLQEAIRMAHEAGLRDHASETWLALARLRLGHTTGPFDVLHLSQLPAPNYLALGLLWHEIGDPEKAARHALDAYRHAWADGEPYVHRYDLTHAAVLLEQLGVPTPTLPPYDPANVPPLPWEDEVVAFIADLRAKRRRSGSQS